MTYLLVLLLLMLPLPAHAAAIQNFYNGLNSTTAASTTSSSYTDIDATNVKLTGFTVGKQYFIHITGVLNENSSGFVCAKVIHGSTTFTASEHCLSGQGSAGANRINFSWFTVWTAVSSEDIKVQYRVTAGTGTAQHFNLFAMNVSDDITSSDWCFNEDTTSTALTTTLSSTNNAACTKTPGIAGHNWLVMAGATLDLDGNLVDVTTQVTRSGEASSSTPIAQPSFSNNASALAVYTLTKVFTLSNVSNTFTEQSASVATNHHTRTRSAVFMLDLDKFHNYCTGFTEGPTNVSASSYATTPATCTITPDTTSDVWFGMSFTLDFNTSDAFHFRTQVDGSDSPANQTTNDFAYGYLLFTAATGEPPVSRSARVNMNNSAHTVDFDTHVNSAANTPTAKYSQVWAVTMELATAGGGGQAPRSAHQYRLRR